MVDLVSTIYATFDTGAVVLNNVLTWWVGLYIILYISDFNIH